MKVILGSHYTGNIAYYKALKNAEEALIEVNDHYEKQSYRSRCEIYGANGKLNLILPLQRRGTRVAMKDVLLDNTQDWQKLHWRSLESAYRSSPYFEYYERHFEGFFHQTFDKLADFNRAIFEKVTTLLEIDTPIRYTEKYEKAYEGFDDLRELIHPKAKNPWNSIDFEYMQVFDMKYDFIPNLSILDLMFNEGPRCVSLL
ncbi:MAG: WbqC family protein [Flavobacteriales bacterium]|nr:WbqC family protein [Flavobacteriales bacterium]